MIYLFLSILLYIATGVLIAVTFKTQSRKIIILSAIGYYITVFAGTCCFVESFGIMSSNALHKIMDVEMPLGYLGFALLFTFPIIAHKKKKKDANNVKVLSFNMLIIFTLEIMFSALLIGIGTYLELRRRFRPTFEVKDAIVLHIGEEYTIDDFITTTNSNSQYIYIVEWNDDEADRNTDDITLNEHHSAFVIDEKHADSVTINIAVNGHDTQPLDATVVVEVEE